MIEIFIMNINRRYTPIVDFDNGPFNFEHGGGGPHVSYAPPAVSLTAIMLLLYCK